MGVRVLGCDPGLASFGVAIIELDAVSERLLSAGVVRTKPSAKKHKVLASDDTLRRAKEIYRKLDELVRGYNVRAIAAESMSYPRIGNQMMVKQIQQLGVAWGILAGLSCAHGLAVVQCSPQALKKALCDTSTASKVDVQLAIASRFGCVFDGMNKGDLEHAADAIGAVLACLDSDVLTYARRPAA